MIELFWVVSEMCDCRRSSSLLDRWRDKLSGEPIAEGEGIEAFVLREENSYASRYLSLPCTRVWETSHRKFRARRSWPTFEASWLTFEETNFVMPRSLIDAESVRNIRPAVCLSP